VHLGIKGKQIAGVSLIVGLAVVGLSVLYLTFVSGTLIKAALETGEFYAQTIFERVRELGSGEPDPWAAIAADRPLQTILRSAGVAPNVAYVAISRVNGETVVEWPPITDGQKPRRAAELKTLTDRNRFLQMITLYFTAAWAYEVQTPLLLNGETVGSIRVGISTTLIRDNMRQVLGTVSVASLVAMLVAVLLAAGFARLILRPIHVIRGGLSRLGRGEFDVRLDLSQQDEFGELGSFFNAVSAQLSAERSQAEGPEAAQAALLNFSRKLVALGRLTAGVAHEVKNPLNAMTIHLELLKQKLTGGAKRRAAGAAPTGAVPFEPQPFDAEPVLEHVRIIAAEIQRLDQVMQGFLKFTRTEDLKPQPLSLATLVDDVVAVIGPECEVAGVRVVVEGVDRLPPVTGDPTMLRQALLNLALNARQAMPEGGSLTISGAVRAGRVEIAVEDTGIGIKPEHLGRIFDLYFTTREQGSGVGLSMVYRTVQLHDGDIEVQSTEGRGTTFRISLPKAP
jgi:signal transduction histidine kinase